MTTVIRPRPLPTRLPEGAGSPPGSERSSEALPRPGGSTSLQRIVDDARTLPPWQQWTPASLAALWPKHGFRPARDYVYQEPDGCRLLPSACAAGILGVELLGLPCRWRSLDDEMATMGYPVPWLTGITHGFDGIDEKFGETPAYVHGYRLGQAVAALVFGAEAAT